MQPEAVQQNLQKVDMMARQKAYLLQQQKYKAKREEHKQQAQETRKEFFLYLHKVEQQKRPRRRSG